MGKTDSFGVGFVSLGGAVQEGEDVFRGDLIDGTIAEPRINRSGIAIYDFTEYSYKF